MSISAVNAYRTAASLPSITPVDTAKPDAAASFGGSLSQAVQDLSGMQQNADNAMVKLASGQPIEMHEAMLAMEEASIGMQFAMQVRTKVIEAYQEVMRTQV